MNERIKAVRMALNLTMEQFGERIGMGKSSVSKIEKGANSTTEQTIKSICREFGVNETWLRTGAGEMFDKSEDATLDRLASEYNLDDRKKAVIAAFLKLNDSDQQAVLRFVDTVASACHSKQMISNPDIDAEVEAYRQELLAQKKAADAVSASTGIADAG